MKILQKHIVPENTSSQRLSDYAPIAFNQIIASRKGIKKAIKKGAISINGKLATTAHWVKPGQLLTFHEIPLVKKRQLEMPLKVILEDDHLAVINKPAGIPVSGNQFRTIENALVYNLKPSSQKDCLSWPRPVHRLDALTCGLLLIAKTSKASVALNKQFQEKTIFKQYIAIVSGKAHEEGYLDQPIDQKQAFTAYKCLLKHRSIKNDWLSMLSVYPKTGRTHQIRIHLSQVGHPILGDKLYGIEGNIKRGKGLFLCAVALSFEHPFNGNSVNVEIDPPPKFLKTMLREESMWMKLKNTKS